MENSDFKKVAFAKEFVNDTSRLLDNRISEINKKLENSKNEITKNCKKTLKEENFSLVDMDNIDLSQLNFDSFVDVNSIKKKSKI
jgi:hypothetical protein